MGTEVRWIEQERIELVSRSRVLIEFEQYEPGVHPTAFWTPLDTDGAVIAGGRRTMDTRPGQSLPDGELEVVRTWDQGHVIAVTPAAPAPLARGEVLEHAGKLIGGDRQRTYGDAAESFSRIAALWSALLKTEVTATDVARCMVAMKLSRLDGMPGHADSWIDAAGYAALGAEIAEARL